VVKVHVSRSEAVVMPLLDACEWALQLASFPDVHAEQASDDAILSLIAMLPPSTEALDLMKRLYTARGNVSVPARPKAERILNELRRLGPGEVDVLDRKREGAESQRRLLQRDAARRKAGLGILGDASTLSDLDGSDERLSPHWLIEDDPSYISFVGTCTMHTSFPAEMVAEVHVKAREWIEGTSLRDLMTFFATYPASHTVNPLIGVPEWVRGLRRHIIVHGALASC
jgi:hypothetical protein